MAQIERGVFKVVNPFNRQVSRIAATADQVHTIVFWSKDFGLFLDNGYGKALMQRGYHLFFNFTINSPHTSLEPLVPPLGQRLAQLDRLCTLYGPSAIHWRFDPICYYKDKSGNIGTNMEQFPFIAQRASDLGITTCITSFVDLYRKVKRRLQDHSELRLIDPSLSEKVDRIIMMAQCLTGLGIQLRLCCEKEVLSALPQGTDVRAAACIPNHHLVHLYGPGISLRKDSGQRAASGCGCRLSRDIGSYHLHPCRHNCLFCYANPACDQA